MLMRDDDIEPATIAMRGKHCVLDRRLAIAWDDCSTVQLHDLAATAREPHLRAVRGHDHLWRVVDLRGAAAIGPDGFKQTHRGDWRGLVILGVRISFDNARQFVEWCERRDPVFVPPNMTLAA